MLESFAAWLVDVVQAAGYPGIFAAMFLGNALVPIPVEAIMIPAGYLVQQHKMHMVALFATAISGDIAGSIFSYFLAYHFGRRIVMSFGKYFFFGPSTMDKLDQFFAKHGEVSTLTGRLVPGLRHFMAFPAGLSHMNLQKFVLYTGVGGGIWTAILIGVGYLIGNERRLVRHYMQFVEGAVIATVIIMIILYVHRHRRQKKEGSNGV